MAKDNVVFACFVVVILCVIIALYFGKTKKTDYEKINNLVGYEDVIPMSVARDLISIRNKHLMNSHEQRNIHEIFAINDRINDIFREHAITNRLIVQRGGHPEMLNINETMTEPLQNILSTTEKRTPTKEKPVNINIEWVPDRQNVHDSKLTDQLNKEYEALKNLNDIENIRLDLGDLMEHLREKADPDVWERITSSSHMNIPERMYIYEVWRRSLSTVNRSNSQSIQNSLISALADCKEKGNVVCSRGRVARIVGSLGGIDPRFGKLATKQSIRTEFLAQCGHLLNKYIKKQPKTLQDDYIHDRPSKDVDILKKKLNILIDNIAKEYKHIPADDLESYKLLAKNEI